MHKAYVVHSPSKIAVQIESIVAYGSNNVIVGTRQVEKFICYCLLSMIHFQTRTLAAVLLPGLVN